MGIPEIYIRPQQEPPIRSHETTTPLPTIPIFDLESLVCGNATYIELERLYTTCKEWGFFQVFNHGVSAPLLEKLKLEIEKFFQLPVKEKAQYEVRPGDVNSYGTVIRCKDQKLDGGDRFYMIINPVGRRKPHLFHELSSSPRDALEPYFSETTKLGMTLFGLLGKALGTDVKEVEIFDDGMQSVRMTYYPPCPQPDLVVRLTPHSDASGITILHQVNGVEVLEIKKGGVRIPVTFYPGAFEVNVGDIMEILSNGAYSSIEHRASVNKEKGRITIAMFFSPKFAAEIGPVKSLLSPEKSPMYKNRAC